MEPVRGGERKGSVKNEQGVWTWQHSILVQTG